ncbi:MAG: ABC transporter ATP-binding protein [Candidatus Limnocylindrales bacterium]
MAGLVLRDLSVRYPTRSRRALEGIDLAVAPGELVGVTGRNGAGKSTLALASVGFIPRVVRAEVGGEVLVDEAPVSTATRAQLVQRVGIVFSTPANQLSAARQTVREELAFGLENLGVAREEIDVHVDLALTELGIRGLAERPPNALSGGEQQRVAIASVLVMGAGILVLDEPTAQLDPAGTDAVAALLLDRARAGIAVLVAEHKASILGRTTRCLVLSEGRTFAIGRPGDVLGASTVDVLGGTEPALVAAAETLGLDPGSGFYPAALAAEIRGQGPMVVGAIPVSPAGPAVTWHDVRAVRPTSIRLSGLTHRYGSLVALQEVDLEIAPGESMAIVGQNGSGKTTLVKHLVGLLRPDAGRVLLDGEDVAGRSIATLARTVGYAFQDPDDQLFSGSVAREVAFGPTNLKLTAADRARLVDQAMAVVGLTADAATNPYDLDLAARKLVALASVCAMDPAILVLDEPTTGQDRPGVARVGAVVDAFIAAGRTVVAVTHDMEFAARHFGRVVVMREGTVVADGPPREIFAPDNASLLASTALRLPPVAELAALLGMAGAPLTVAELLAEIRG